MFGMVQSTKTITQWNDYCVLYAKRIIVDKGFLKGIVPIDYHLKVMEDKEWQH